MNTQEIVETLKANISKVIKGKEEIIHLFICSFLTGGNVLLNDIPGVGKTTMVKALSKLIQKDTNPIEFKRLQCTPDLLPYDITGVDVFNAKTNNFEFMPGPIFCDIFLADELNRTPPKVQSALLEVMEEKQITIGKKTHPLSPLFFVAATQNPVESLGTYPLPAAQLDRFMVSLSIGYPDAISAIEILSENSGKNELNKLQPVISHYNILNSKEEQKEVFCHSALKKAIVDICNLSRTNTDIELGISPRGSLHLLALAKTIALSYGRNWVEDKDLKQIATETLAHRCILKNKKINPNEFIKEITSKALSKMEKITNWSTERNF